MVVLVAHDSDCIALEHKLQAILVQGVGQCDWSIDQVPIGIATTKEPVVEVPVLHDPLCCLNRIVIRGLKEAKVVTSGEYVWVGLLVGLVGSGSFAILGCNLYVQVLELIITKLCEEGAGSILDWLCAICIIQSS